MGARQSKRSVDITTTPKKEGMPAEGGVVGDAAAPGDGKLERIEETDTKPTTNGIAPHTDMAEDKDKDKDDATEKGKEKDEVKADETKQESTGESPTEAGEATTPTEATATSPNAATPDSKETKKKDKMKKKWSFRSISFSKKDKNKPPREEAPKNGDVTKEEPLAEGGEEGENASATAGSPTEDKSAVSSPSAEKEGTTPVPAATPSTEAKEEATVAVSAASSPADEKKEEPTPSTPAPAPVEDKKEEVEKVEAEKKVVEVSPAGGQSIVDPVEVSVFRVQPVATPSIIERKTSEDIPSLPPSSPPPTPIDPSPLQQAQQAAANATALAEALKLPAEAAEKELIAPPPSEPPTTTVFSLSCQDSHDPPKSPTESSSVPLRPISSSTDETPPEQPTFVVSANLEALPVVDTDTNVPDVAATENLDSSTSDRGEKLEVEALPVVDNHANSLDNATKERCPVVSEIDDNKSVEIETAPTIEREMKDLEDAIKEDTSPLKTNCKKESESEVLSVIDKVTTCSLEKSPEIKADKKVETLSSEASPKNAENVEETSKSDIVSNGVDTTSGKSNVDTVAKEASAEVIAIDVEEVESSAEIVAKPAEEIIEQQVIEPSSDVMEGERKEEECVKEEVVIETSESASELVLDSEEGPIPVSEEVVVEAKPALVISEDEVVEEMADTEADVSKVDTESVEVILDADEEKFEKLENETQSDTPLSTEEILISDEPEEPSVSEGATIEKSEPIDGTIVVVEKVDEGEKHIIDIAEVEDQPPPSSPSSPSSPSVSETPLSTTEVNFESVNVKTEIDTTPTQVADTEPTVKSETIVEETRKVEESPLSQVEQTETTVESSPSNASVLPVSSSSMVVDSSRSSIADKDPSLVKDSQADLPSSRFESISVPSDDLPPAPQDTVECVDSSEYPLPPEELSCPSIPSNLSEIKSELPVSTENASSLRNPTETLLTPPRSPSPQSNVSIASGITTSTKDCSQTQLYDDQSNREFKMESVSISLNSYNESDIELKERLAESLAETENQEESFSCQLSNSATSTAAQEIHQSTPEPEVPVENNVAHEVSTTESSDEAPKIAPPAVPIEAPVLPPSAPAITEDVASVTKAIEEIDISDKAVAAATIECTTNEIIADGHQNDINE